MNAIKKANGYIATKDCAKADVYDPASLPPPMPEQYRHQILDTLMGMKLMAPTRVYSEAEMIRAVADWWPGVRPSQIRAVLARQAGIENQAREAARAARRESG